MLLNSIKSLVARIFSHKTEATSTAMPDPADPAVVPRYWHERDEKLSAASRMTTSEQLMRINGTLAEVDGKPTYELAATSKHDLKEMIRCCEAEATNYWRQAEGSRLCAAPFYFDRVAILSRKAKDYQREIAICEQWKAIADDYKKQPMVKAREAALVHKGPRSEAILARLPKARELLRKQKADAKAKARQ